MNYQLVIEKIKAFVKSLGKKSSDGYVIIELQIKYYKIDIF